MASFAKKGSTLVFSRQSFHPIVLLSLALSRSLSLCLSLSLPLSLCHTCKNKTQDVFVKKQALSSIFRKGHWLSLEMIHVCVMSPSKTRNKKTHREGNKDERGILGQITSSEPDNET